MVINGIDLSKLEGPGKIDHPPTVPGRTVQIDADFLAYYVTYEREYEDKSFEEMQMAVDTMVEQFRLLAGAEFAKLHVTPKESNKGGREDIALLQPYQEKRVTEKPRYLDAIRIWMHQERGAELCLTMEADDSMAIHQYACYDNDKRDLSVICSKDKDLRMVPGWHLDWDTGEMIYVEDFGYIELDTSKSTKKVVGYGWAFFWAQMLMGDSVDNISGLPGVTGQVLNRLKPTKAISAAQAVLSNPDATERQRKSAQKKLDDRKTGLCGPVMAYDIIKRCGNNKKAYEVVKYLYKQYGEEHGFTNWRDGSMVMWQKAFISEAKLLWMRRWNVEDDVARWMVATCR